MQLLISVIYALSMNLDTSYICSNVFIVFLSFSLPILLL